MSSFQIPYYIKHLTNLRAILEKAKVWQGEHKIADETIMNARIALDQFTLAQQVRSASSFAKNIGATLCGVDAPQTEDAEKTLTDLQVRIDTIITFLSTLTEVMVKTDLDTRLVPLYWMPGKGLAAKYFVEEYASANFHFHYVTAYSILRHYGLAIGKADFMGSVDLKDLA